MAIVELDPETAYARLREEPGSIYLDVRSSVEYEQGHPVDAWNLPLLHMTGTGMARNGEFEDVAEAVLPKDALILVGCRSGQRSFMACQILIQLGYERVANVTGGFAGQTDPATGQLVAPGWERSGLPSTGEATPGMSWEDLRRKL